MAKNPTVSELIIEGYGDGGFRAEHAAAVTMADAAGEMVMVLRETKEFIESMPMSHKTMAAITRINHVLAKAVTPAVSNAS